jgi:signal transduction histidine kinase
MQAGQLKAGAGGVEAIPVARDFNGPLQIGTWLDIFEDKSAQRSLEDVLDQAFVRSSVAAPHFGFNTSAFWSRFVIDNASNEARELILVHQYVQTDWVELYSMQDGVYRKIVNGDNGTVKDPDATVEYIRPSFRLIVPPGKSVHYIRIKSRGIIQLDFALWSERKFYSYMTREYLILACFFGILFVMTFYNLFLYFMIQDASYLYYVFFTAIFALTSVLILGFGNVFFPEMVLLNNEGYVFLTGVTLVAAFRFSVTYLDLKNQERVWYRIGLLFEGLAWLVSVTVCFNYAAGAILSVVMAAVVPIYLITMGYWLSWKRNRNAYFYSMAWTMLAIFSVYRMLGLAGVIQKNILTEYGQNLGSVLELIILSLGVGDKLRRARQEVVKQKMEAQRRLRSSLQTRFLIVSNLAHRMNNPLNYIQTGLISLSKSITQHRQELVPLLPSEDNRSEQESVICQTLVQRLDDMEQMLADVQVGVSRSSQSITEIRSLSGIDGHYIERLRVSDLVDEAHRRLKEFRGNEAMKRLSISIHDDATCSVACNRYALSIGFETLLREILDGGPGDCQIQFVVWPGPDEGFTRLHIQIKQKHPFEGASVSLLGDLLATYGVSVLADLQQKSQSFELLIPNNIHKATTAVTQEAS